MQPEDDAAEGFSPLGPLLWELALRGSRDALLPEIGGQSAYRIAPGADLERLNLWRAHAGRCGGTPEGADHNLRDHGDQWPGFDRERAMRACSMRCTCRPG
jgi:hypothetical protein